MIPIIVIVVGVVMIAIELARPARKWPKVAGWWVRAILFNGLQVGAVYFAGVAWDGWLLEHRLWSLESLGPTAGGVVGYLVLTFVYYWWHRARHESQLLWNVFHQFHHSPRRIEIVTTFIYACILPTWSPGASRCSRAPGRSPTPRRARWPMRSPIYLRGSTRPGS